MAKEYFKLLKLMLKESSFSMNYNLLNYPFCYNAIKENYCKKLVELKFIVSII